jgi:hypothetical protein
MRRSPADDRTCTGRRVSALGRGAGREVPRSTHWAVVVVLEHAAITYLAMVRPLHDLSHLVASSKRNTHLWSDRPASLAPCQIRLGHPHVVRPSNTLDGRLRSRSRPETTGPGYTRCVLDEAGRDLAHVVVVCDEVGRCQDAERDGQERPGQARRYDIN